MAEAFSFINKLFGPPIPIQQSREIGGARGKVMARLGELSQEGVPANQLLAKILQDPTFHEAFVGDPDIGKTVQEMIAEIQKQSLPQGVENMTPGSQLVQPDASGKYNVVASNPKSPNAGNTTDAYDALFGPGGLVDQGLIDPIRARKLLVPGMFKPIMTRDAAGNLVESGFVDMSTGEKFDYTPPPASSPSIPGPPAGDQGSSVPAGAVQPRADTGQPAPTQPGTEVTPTPSPTPAPTVQPAPVALPPAASSKPAPGEALPQVTGPLDLPRAGASIKSIESGSPQGNYQALGKVIINKKTKKEDRALGAYQIMMSNLPQWSREVVGRVVSPREFLDNSKIQDDIFNAKFTQYVQKYGNVTDAASAWFTGKPYKGNENKTDKYTKNSEYVRQFLANYTGDQGPVNTGESANTQNVIDQTPIPADGKTSVDAYGLADPADMFLGAGFLPAIKEFGSTVLKGATGETSVFGSGATGDQRSALRNLRTAVYGLKDNSKVLKQQLDVLKSQVDNLGVNDDPETSLNDALNLQKNILGMRAEAVKEYQDPTSLAPMKEQAAKDILNFDYVLQAMPTREAMINKLKQVRQGTAGQLTIPDAMKQAGETLRKGIEVLGGDVKKGVTEGEAAVQGETDRTASIKTMDAIQLEQLAKNPNPPLTPAEKAAASARFRELQGGK